MVICRSFQIRSLLGVNEEFENKQSAEDDPLSQERTQFLVRRVSDVLAGRRMKKRSLPGVNEHFSDKPDDADDPLSQEII